MKRTSLLSLSSIVGVRSFLSTSPHARPFVAPTVERLRAEQATEAKAEQTEEPRPSLISDLMQHPFFNWRWSVVDVALIFVLIYTLH